MPGLNRMGPNGTGPMTGGNRGYCDSRNNSVEPGNKNILSRGQTAKRYSGLGRRCDMVRSLCRRMGQFEEQTYDASSEQLADDKGIALRQLVNSAKSILEQIDRHLIAAVK